MVLACLLTAGPAPAADSGLPSGRPKLLPPEQAFHFSARALDAQTIEARFDVVDGYYLYRDKLRFAVESGGSSLGPAELPAGKRKKDEFFGDVETYRGAVTVRLPLVAAAPGKTLVVHADSQGCPDAGVCFAPNPQQLMLVVPASGAKPGPYVEAKPKGLFR